MITKAQILQLPKGAYTDKDGKLVVDNKFKIYIPIFRRAGESKDSKLSASIMYATLLYTPGSENGYRVGDIVYISFENNQMGNPIILGKLFLNTTQDVPNTASIIGDNLNISGKATLPKDTKIGEVTGNEIEKLFRLVSNNTNLIDGKSGEYTGGTGIDITNDVISIDDTVALKSEIPSKTSDLDNDSGFIDNSVDDLVNYTLTSNLSNVATSGDYDDLLNKPTIPQVSANPSTTTQTLTGLTLDGINYVVPSGSSGTLLYEHNIFISESNVATSTDTITFRVLSNSPTPMIESEVADLLYTRGNNEIETCITASGRVSDDSFEYVTSIDIDWSEHDAELSYGYCDSIIIGVYGTNASELMFVVIDLSEGAQNKVYSITYSGDNWHDTVVRLL